MCAKCFIVAPATNWNYEEEFPLEHFKKIADNFKFVPAPPKRPLMSDDADDSDSMDSGVSVATALSSVATARPAKVRRLMVPLDVDEDSRDSAGSSTSRASSSASSSAPAVWCEQCQFSVPYSHKRRHEQSKRHLNARVPTPFPCPQCHKQYASNQRLKGHISKDHAE